VKSIYLTAIGDFVAGGGATHDFTHPKRGCVLQKHINRATGSDQDLLFIKHILFFIVVILDKWDGMIIYRTSRINF